MSNFCSKNLNLSHTCIYKNIYFLAVFVLSNYNCDTTLKVKIEEWGVICPTTLVMCLYCDNREEKILRTLVPHWKSRTISSEICSPSKAADRACLCFSGILEKTDQATSWCVYMPCALGPLRVMQGHGAENPMNEAWCYDFQNKGLKRQSQSTDCL